MSQERLHETSAFLLQSTLKTRIRLRGERRFIWRPVRSRCVNQPSITSFPKSQRAVKKTFTCILVISHTFPLLLFPRHVSSEYTYRPSHSVGRTEKTPSCHAIMKSARSRKIENCLSVPRTFEPLSTTIFIHPSIHPPSCIQPETPNLPLHLNFKPQH